MINNDRFPNYGENSWDFLVMEKIFQSLSLHFEYVVEVIEESKDLSEMSIEEL